MNKRQHQAFTLIEVIIALAVFAVIATLSGSVLVQSFNTRNHLAVETERINTFDLAITLIRRDVAQILNRPIRGTELHLFPPFVGQPNYTEFTRGGFVNPQSTQLSSTLKRMALLCKGEQLIRRTWLTLDGPTHHDYQDRILLDHLKACSFHYLSRSLELLPTWQPYALQQNQKNQSIPAAIQLNLTLEHLGNIRLFFVIPEALYGE